MLLCISVIQCPLCFQSNSDSLQLPRHGNQGRVEYFDCSQCGLVFLNPNDFLEPHDEKARYDQHNNSARDPRYIQYLTQFITALEQLLPNTVFAEAHLLDFGCGPEPVLGELFKQKGAHVKNFDPFFFPHEFNLASMQNCFDWITCCEAAEHFYLPNQVFLKFKELLRAEGECYLGVKTQLLLPEIDFASWYYRQDPTHVCFYRPQTMHYLAQEILKLKVQSNGKDVTVFYRN